MAASILRIVAWLLVGVVVLVLAGVCYVSFADLNWLKPRLESIVAGVTGYRLELGGAIDLDIVPAPAVLLEHVVLSNSHWGSQPKLASIGHLTARLDPWSLLSGHLRLAAAN